MTNGEFKYDVAFSFLGQDEQTAAAISDLLKDRWKTFIYSEQQKNLVGRDGEEVLNRAFGKESRLVVVLYRPEWGSTPWTRVEETAIRRRAHFEGYDFTLFVPMDTPPTTPAWLPPTRIYSNIARFGVPGTAQHIEGRLEEAGGGSRAETIEQKAARLNREEREERAKLAFIVVHGKDLAGREAIALLDRMTELASKIGATPERVVDQRCLGCFQKSGFTTCAGWYPGPYLNTMDESVLVMTLWGGIWRLRPDIYGRKKPPIVRETNYVFDVTRVTHQALWRPQRGNEPALSTVSLADLWMNQFLDHIEKARLSKR